MIINIKNKKDLITIDFSLRQIRYLKDFEKRGEIEFYNLTNQEIEILNYVYAYKNKNFLDSVKRILEERDVKVKLKNLKVIDLARGF